MRRWLLAAAGLGLVAVADARAQQNQSGYIVIRVNLSAEGGQPAAPPGGGSDVTGPGGFQPPGPPGGGGFQPPGQGSPRGGKRPPGMQPPGLPGGGPPGPMGGGSGFGPPGGGFFGGQIQRQQGSSLDPSRSIAVVVPYKYIARSHNSKPSWPYVLHSDYGTTFLYTSKGYIQLYPLDRRQYPYLPTRVSNDYNKWAKTKLPPQTGYDLVAEALSYNMVDEAWKWAEALADLVKARPDIPAPVTVTNFVKAFNQIRQAVADPLPDAGEAARWQTTLGAAAVEQGAHYCLVHWGDQSVSREGTSRRVQALESNYKAFYLWHALGGVALKAPDRKLVVVLADKASDMPRMRDALDGKPIVSDAFYAPQHNLVVLSPERLDDAGRTFTRYVQSKYQEGWNREELLRKVPTMRAHEKAEDLAHIMTLALVDRVSEEEMIVAQVTREGSRQLVAASGELAQYVMPPEWLEHGAANLLNKPKGPHYWTDPQRGHMMTVGITSGYGSPNYILVREFRDLVAQREINPDSEELLTNTLLDRYFDAARAGKDADPEPKKSPNDNSVPIAGGGAPGFGPPGGGFGPPGPMGPPGFAPPSGGSSGGPPGFGPPGPMGPMGPGAGAGFGQLQSDPDAEQRRLKARLDRKAQVTAWGLTFYLAKRKMPALLRFYAELDRMPRDMRLDHHQVLVTFCRCMGLTEVNNPEQINKAEFKRFADDWVAFLKVYSSWGVDIPVKDDQTDPNQGVNPGGGFPGGPPGGMPGPGGGFPGPGGGFPGRGGRGPNG